MNQLLIVCIAVFLTCGTPIIEVTPPTEEVKPEQDYPLPKRCEHFLEERDPKTWNPETELYPPNTEWEECMGVARKSWETW